MIVRPPAPTELVRLQEIEVAAGAAFADVGMPEIAADEPFTTAELDAYRRAGRAWVLDDDGRVAGYILVDLLDGAVHVEQVTVHPDWARRGLGRVLFDHVATWAASHGLDAVTLTTFRDVPWNAPLYERYGFRVLGEDEIGPELRARRGEEAAHGLDSSARVCMARPVL